MTARAELSDEACSDLISRGYSRRSLGKVLGLFAAAPALGSALASAAAAQSAKGMVMIGANECWTGPLAPGAEAAAAAIATGNRYTGAQRNDFAKALAAVEDVPVGHIMTWPGSSDPLSRIIVTYCSPTRGLVTADPTFELAGSVAQYLGVKTSRVPLRADYAHDVKAMLAADPNAGVYYICTPNNPSATLTGLPDVEWLLANKPAGSIVLLDEAYIHFSEAKPGAYLAAQNKDIIVLRTFSKLFGMAGMRLGATIARPDLMTKTMRYDGGMASFALPNPSLVCGTASLTATGLIKARRDEMIAVRSKSLALLDKRGIEHVPTEANFFMVDWKKPAKEVQAAFAKEGVAIGRSWPIWPTRSRVTVGSAAEMAAFDAAVVKLNL
ncbi:MAG: pyridoxal phosphate-dependent aminotransferase [Phenylobacterium sp.]|uniref:pyridoxal phosphate-dependent aminotransferase n=1 Tax=Phenylobacterium sp. TaxID=1871053 RepID=UPI003BB4FB2F